MSLPVPISERRGQRKQQRSANAAAEIQPCTDCARGAVDWVPDVYCNCETILAAIRAKPRRKRTDV